MPANMFQACNDEWVQRNVNPGSAKWSLLVRVIPSQTPASSSRRAKSPPEVQLLIETITYYPAIYRFALELLAEQDSVIVVGLNIQDQPRKRGVASEGEEGESSRISR